MSMPYEELVAEYIKCAIKQGKVEELEKIKEEIKQKQPIGYINGAYVEGYDESIEIIDKHIKEMKGEK